MKKFILSAVAAVLAFGAAEAQEYKVYCQIVGVSKFMSKKVSVRVDFGQTPSAHNALVDENGKKIIFNSMIDAMNYMSRLGWEFECVYVTTLGTDPNSKQLVHHWLLSKRLSKDEPVDGGLTTEHKFREQQLPPDKPAAEEPKD